MARAQTRREKALALSRDVVRAAGGAVVRAGGSGDARILAVHRPRYDDWSLPKGKCEPGESDIECALREVQEETGLQCEIGPKLAEIAYRDQKDRAKTVVYFLMEPVAGEFARNDEVDEIRWLTLSESAVLLSYGHDAEIARSALRSTRPR